MVKQVIARALSVEAQDLLDKCRELCPRFEFARVMHREGWAITASVYLRGAENKTRSFELSEFEQPAGREYVEEHVLKTCAKQLPGLIARCKAEGGDAS